MTELDKLFRRPARNYEPDYPPTWSSPIWSAPPPKTPLPQTPPTPPRKPKLTAAQQQALDAATHALANGHLSDDAKRILTPFVNRPDVRMSPPRLARDTQLGREQVAEALAELIAAGHLRMVGTVGRARTPAFGIWR